MTEPACNHVAFLGGILYSCTGHEDGSHHFGNGDCEAAWCRLPAGHRSLHDIPPGKPEFSYHGREPLYDAADGCGHDRPQEPDTEWSADDEAWQEFDAWTEDHQPGTSEDGELICLLSPGGFYCPACSLASKDRGNDEYVECEVADDA
ncbi:MAG TPA: hypothetical protein VIZ43_08395 [Trebonia sp.]